MGVENYGTKFEGQSVCSLYSLTKFVGQSLCSLVTIGSLESPANTYQELFFLFLSGAARDSTTSSETLNRKTGLVVCVQCTRSFRRTTALILNDESERKQWWLKVNIPNLFIMKTARDGRDIAPYWHSSVTTPRWTCEWEIAQWSKVYFVLFCTGS